LIRTALTLNINPADMQSNSYLANGTHLGLLAQSAQNIHVQTSHRPLQLIVALRADDTSSAALTRQRQLINAWQDFAQLLARRGTGELNSLMLQYHLEPSWLILMDEYRLQAWLPEDIGFYLLRQDVLRRLRPIPPRGLPGADVPPDSDRRYYSLSIAQGDQFCLLPPELLSFFGSGEASGILMGLRQLPARMSDLFNTARQRGFTGDFTWLALQIVHLELDELPGALKAKKVTRPGLITVLLNRGRTIQSAEQENDSLSLSECQDEIAEPPDRPSLLQQLLRNRIWLLAAGLLAVVIIVVLSLLIGGLLTPRETTATTATTTMASTVQPTLTPTKKPTQPTTTATTLPQLTVTGHQLNLRESADRNSRLLTTLQNGAILSQLAEPEGDWVKVRTEDGLTGYVFYKYVQPVTP
jgi:hypothetical protein